MIARRTKGGNAAKGFQSMASGRIVTRRLSCTWSASLTSSSAVGPLLVCDILFLFPAPSGRPQRFETRAHFTDEQLRLFPRAEGSTPHVTMRIYYTKVSIHTLVLIRLDTDTKV